MQMIERSDQANFARQQHAVAEYVAAHVADAGNGKLVSLYVNALFAKMTLHRFPGAACGNAHLLVIIAGRAAGRERVVKPESVFLRDGVGDVAERRRALVSRNDEVGVIAVPSADLLRGDDFAVHDVVRDVEQPGDEGLVAGDPGLHDRFGTKPPFAPVGTITVFLTTCAFMRPSTSVLKSSRLSDQRSPPRATAPPRRCTPSTSGEYTKISNFGRGSGISGTRDGSSLIEM